MKNKTLKEINIIKNKILDALENESVQKSIAALRTVVVLLMKETLDNDVAKETAATIYLLR